MISRIIKTLPIVTIFIAWFYTYSKGITTAIDTWTISEIFNHCFLVIPGAFFLIYQKRIQLIQQPFVTNYWLLLPLTGTLLLYTFGYVGDIRLFMHIATFVSLPVIIWFIIGNKAAKTIAFPLYFMLFAIPVGEQLIPYLQELTTDLSVPLLEMTGVPIYRNGLYLDIPAGRFLVAEACSGISFLVASVVFGHLYAYISFRTLTKQLLFVFISLIVPIMANALRVYGIVLTAHLTDMEYAAGADHLIYGGVFYAIILFLLIMIGERFRDKFVVVKPQVNVSGVVPFVKTQYRIVSVIAIGLFFSQTIWLYSIESNKLATVEKDQSIDFASINLSYKEEKLTSWRPNFSSASKVQQGHFLLNKADNVIDYFVVAYTNNAGELTSSLNKLYSADRWVLLENRTIKIRDGFSVILTKLSSPTGHIRHIIHWYQLGGIKYTSKIKMKLHQTMEQLMGENKPEYMFSFGVQSSEAFTDIENSKQILLKFVKDNAHSIH